MMYTLRINSALLLLPFVAAGLLVSSGCGGGSKDEDGGAPPPPPRVKSKDGGGKRPGRTEFESTGWGTLKGKVTFEGDKPTVADISTRDDFKQHQDKDFCAKGDLTEQVWKFGEGNGLANVVVWLKPPEGKTFKIPADKNWPMEVKIDQPHCAFEPHVVTLFPSYYDVNQNKPVPSGQVFKILNSATIKHNTKWAGSQLRNSEQSQTLDAKKDKPAELEIKIQPDTEPISFKCDFHKWMTGYAWAFDHPYAAVTDKDGNFEIKNVPAGAEVEIDFWHESFGKTPKVLKKATLKAGENVENFSIKK